MTFYFIMSMKVPQIRIIILSKHFDGGTQIKVIKQENACTFRVISCIFCAFLLLISLINKYLTIEGIICADFNSKYFR